MVSGISVPCHGQLGVEVLEPKTDGTWTHVDIMRNVNAAIDQFESLYPGCLLLVTYDNAPSHVAKRKGALSTTVAKGALTICMERGWEGSEQMRHDELRALLASQPDFCSVNQTSVVLTRITRTPWPYPPVWPQMPSRMYAH